MTARAANTTRSVHVLAVAAGLIFGPLALVFARFIADVLGASVRDAGLIVPAVGFLFYAGVGAFFGLVWPAKSWRWGVWVSLLPFVWASFVSPSVMLWLASMTLLPACAGSLAASRRQLRRAAANQSAYLRNAAQNRRLTYD